MVEEAMNEAENSIIQINYTGTLIHKWFKRDDLRQKYVQYAYKLGWMDFVKLIECEAGNWSIFTKGDSWHAWGLCQLNDNYHKVSEEYKNTWQVQIETCYKKRKGWTIFYGPNRIIKGQKCSSYVADRFILES